MATTNRYRLYRADNEQPIGKIFICEDAARRLASRFSLAVEVWRIGSKGQRVELVAEYGGGRAA